MKSRLAAVAALAFGLTIALLIAFAGNGSAATAARAFGPLQPAVTQELKHDASAPLRDLVRISQPVPANRPTGPDDVDAINRILPNKRPDPKFIAELKELGWDVEEYYQSLHVPDAVLQSDYGVPYAPATMPPTIQNFEGISQDEMQAVVPPPNNYIPPDTDGEIGYDPATGKKYYVGWVNTAYAIWDVTTAPTRLITATGNSLWTGFGGPCETTNDGDPIVLFDQLANRWFMSQFALPNIDTNNGPFYQCIAVSQSGDPTGAYHRYAYLWSNTKLNDYPKFGVWPDGYYMSINQFNAPTFNWGGAGVAVFDRARMLSGLSASMISFDLFSVNDNFGGQLPSDLDGSTLPPPGTPNYFYEVDDSTISPGLGPDALRIWKFHVDWTTPANSTFGVNGTPNYTLTVSPFNVICPSTRSCVPQPGTSARLDAIGDRLMHRAAYRIVNGQERVVLNHTVDAGSARAGVRWYEVREVGTSPVIYQQSTYAPADTEHRWMASLALDHVGNIALGYSVSSGAVHPGVRYTGRLDSDPLGVMAQGEASLIEGTGSQTDSAARWGDYSAMSVDPVDDCTFWYTQEYYATLSARDWHTRIGSFKFPNCSIGSQGAIAGEVTNASNSNPIAGARVDATLSPTQTYLGFSNPSGNYTFLVPVGTYTLTGAAYGYLPATFTNVQVVSGTTTTQNIALTPAASYVISGFVRDSATNNPLWATVAVIGVPFNPPFSSVQTDPSTGFYSMTVSGGQSYTLTASALLHTAFSQGATPVADTTVNFNLVATTQNGGIIGWVRNYYTNDPIPNATVTAAPGGASDLTDANGYFEIFNLTPGTYTATASANLYSSVSISGIQVLSSNVTIRTFLLPTAQLNYHPPALNKTLTFGQVATDTAGLVISNTGIGQLSWALQERQGGYTPLLPTVGQYLVVNRLSATSAAAITTALTTLGYTYDTVANTVFEGYTLAQLQQYQAVLYIGNTGTSATSASNLKLQEYLDAGGRLLIADNDLGFFNTGFPFYDTYLQSAYVGDDALSNLTGSVVGEDLMSGITADISGDPFPDWYSAASSENTPIFRYSTAGAGNGQPGGSRIIRNNYKTVYLAFDYQYLGTSAVGEPIEAEVLQSALTFLVGGAFDAVPWITESPITGTLTQNSQQGIQLVWDASVADITQPGVYSASLRIDNNDPVAQNTVLPVALTVLPAADQGFLTGIVSTTGVCDVNLAPLNGAQVYLEGSGGFTHTLLTNAAGQYGYWLGDGQSPYTVTVSYPNHPTTSVSASVTSGFTTTQNFTLRLQKPCIHVTPDNLQASAVLGNAAPNQTVYVTSSGALPLDFDVFETPSSVTVGGGPDAFGYTWITSTFNYLSATDGTALGLSDDAEANIVLPFPFTFYGVSSTNLRIANNGAALFNATTGDVAVTNVEMANAPNFFIAPFWDDIDADTGNVYWKTVGIAPHRQVIVEWYNRPHFSNVGSATFEMILFENGNILYQYLDTDFGNASFSNGASATSGVRGANAANSLQYSFNQAVLTNGLALCFVKPGNPPCDAEDMPWLSVTPTSTLGLTGTPPSVQQLTVGFDASSLPLPGTYTANLLISHNAPQPAVNVPVTFTVAAPPTYGQIDGAVDGLAACDAPGSPLQGAAVAITGGTVATTTTNASGQYSYYLLGGSAYTLTVSKPGYVSQQAVVNVTAQQTTTTNFDLRLIAPCQSLSAISFSSAQQPDQVMTKTLTISNTGVSPLTWSIQELASAQGVTTGPQNNDRQPRYNAPRNFAPAAPLVNAIQDGSFEATNGTTYSNPYWGQGSTTFGTILCNVAGCTPPGGTQAPRTGAFWAWFGGSSSGDVGYVQQTVVMTPGVSVLNFYLKMEANSNPGNFLKVSIDGTPVFTATTANQGGYASYTLVSVDVTAFANGAARVVRFDSTTLGSGNFHVDDVALDITGPACAPNALPWLTAVPVSGTVAAGNSANVNLVFNSTGLANGVYTGRLCYASDDLIAPDVQIPVTLTVGASYGVQLEPSAAAASGNPGVMVTHTLHITNTGGASDTFAVALSSHAWNTQTPAQITLPAGGSTSLNVQVTVPANALSGATDTVTVTVTSQGDAAQHDAAILTTTANTVYGVNLTAASFALVGAAGKPVTYTLFVTNTSNVSGTFHFTTTLNSWPMQVPADVVLNAGAGSIAYVVVNVPANAAGGQNDTAIVVVNMLQHPATQQTVSLYTVVPRRLIYLPLIQR